MEIYCFLLGRHAIIKMKRGVAPTTPLWTAPLKTVARLTIYKKK